MSNSLYADAPGERREFGRLYPPRPDWLARQVDEPILEPDLPIVDTHFHFIDVPGFRYMTEEFRADLQSGHRVEATVYAEAESAYRTDGPAALRPVGETEFVARLTQDDPPMATGIVGYADLMLGASVEEPLAAHITAGQGRFKGVRYTVAKDADPAIRVHHQAPAGVLRDARFHAALDVLERLGLSFDSWAFFHQQQDIAALADAHPGLNVVAEHCGGLLGYAGYTGRAEEVFTVWRSNMARLARCPNVSLKIGGTLGRLASYDYLNVERPEPSEALAACLGRYVLTCIELFGPQRCMFESNFPVDAMVCSYAVLWNTFKRITAAFTDAEKLALYGGTARRVYRLG